jgi:transcriptional regulator with XRE-family HTH domain
MVAAVDALETIGTRIRRLRKEAGLSQEELSNLTYVSRETVRDWEKDACRIKSDALVALAQCFRVSADFILGIDSANIRLDRLTEDEAKSVTMLVQAMEKANGPASEP